MNTILLFLTLPAIGVLAIGLEGAPCSNNDNSQCAPHLSCNAGFCGPRCTLEDHWEDHCMGDPCAGNNNNCGGSLVCSPSTNTCVAPEDWLGHGIGTACGNDDDCTNDLVCNGGRCYVDNQCSWAGHCIFAPCTNDNGCAGELVCNAGRCGNPIIQVTGTLEEGAFCSNHNECKTLECTGNRCVPPCNWPNHCLGASCTNENDCGSELVCSSQKKCIAASNWAGHGIGTSCGNDNDCSDDLVCRGGRCNLEHSCSWEGHCYGAPCGSFNDCAGELTCQGGRCTQTGLALTKRMKVRGAGQ